MKKNINIQLKRSLLGLVSILATCFVTTSCREQIDTSALYTYTGETVESFLSKDTICAQYYELLKIVPQSSKSQSSVASLMSAYGHYTCFAPTNEAIDNYLNTMQSKISTLNFQEFVDSVKSGSHVYDSLAKVIVYNSIIDCGNQSAYETAAFPAGRFSLANMNDRYLTASATANAGEKLVYSISGTNRVIDGDHEVENGYVHILDGVIAPTDASIFELLEGKEDMQLFATLLRETGWTDALLADRDQEYEDEIYPTLEVSASFASEGGDLHVIPDTRKYGFTAFVETDEVYRNLLGNDVTAGNIIEKLADYLKNSGKYSFSDGAFNGLNWDTDKESIKDPDNIINQFVSYHLLPVNLASDKMVIHYNEVGFNVNNYVNNGVITPSIPVFEYYETMSKNNRRKLLKITESKNSNGLKINRKMNMIIDAKTYEEGAAVMGNNGRSGEGISIDVNLDDINEHEAMNGMIYPINDLLVYDDFVVQQVLNERLRFDIASLMPELINLNYRRPTKNYVIDGVTKQYLDFPIGFDLVNMERQPGTYVFYLPGHLGNPLWGDYQYDEFIVFGTFDFTFKLPPVPSDGTYEIRYGISGNTLRGMAQVYFGTKGNIQPAGIPLDLRLGGNYGTLAKYGWEEESEDEDYNLEVAKRLRNKDYMRAPRYYTIGVGDGVKQAYTGDTKGRKILVRQDLKANETYYLRFKSVLEDAKSEFFFDYIELCPKGVYANPNQPEDEW